MATFRVWAPQRQRVDLVLGERHLPMRHAAGVNPQGEATFTACKLDWDECGRSPHAELLAWYRELSRLRRRRSRCPEPPELGQQGGFVPLL